MLVILLLAFLALSALVAFWCACYILGRIWARIVLSLLSDD
jgi:hypothetical protein